MQERLLSHQDKMNTLLEQERMIFGSAGDLVGFRELRAWFAPYYRLGTGVHDLTHKRRHWRGCPLPEINPIEVDELLRTSTEGIKSLQRELAGNAAALGILEHQNRDVADLARQLPFIEVLCSPALRARHWEAIKETLKSAADPSSLTLGQLELLPLEQCLGQLTEISEKAEREARLERKLNEMEQDWRDQVLELTAFRDTELKVLQGACVEETQARLEEHCLLAHTIRSSPDVGPLQKQAEDWELKLSMLQEAIEIWARVQANFLYLEPVMRSGDIKLTLPKESKEFGVASDTWNSLIAKISPRKQTILIPEDPSILELLMEADKILEKILKSMNAYLQTKREAFARFYFLSNEELLDALGQSNRPEKVQNHLKKCFEGIDKLTFNQSKSGPTIIGLISPEGEKVPILKPVVPIEYNNAVEAWLLELEDQMTQSIQSLVHECL